MQAAHPEALKVDVPAIVPLREEAALRRCGRIEQRVLHSTPEHGINVPMISFITAMQHVSALQR